MNKKHCLTLIFLFTTLLSMAQPGVPPAAVDLAVDFSKYSITPAVPYNKNFHLNGTAPANVIKMKLYIKEGYFSGTGQLGNAYFISEWNSLAGNTAFTLLANGLGPNKHYSLEILGLNVAGNVILDFQYPVNTNAPVGDQVKMDFGLLYSPRPKAFAGEIAAHIFLVPVNDNSDMAEVTGFGNNVLQRTSGYLGLSILTFDSDTKQPMKNFVGLGNIVYGISVHSPFYGSYLFVNNQAARKILQPMYINFGVLLFKQADANPLIVKDRNKSTFYIGMSYDFNFSSLFGPLTKIFTP